MTPRCRGTRPIKVLPAEAMKSPAAVERFHREVRAAARLSHRNIVTAYDAGEHDGMHFLVMEYVEGKDLGQIVAQHGPLTVERAVECIVQAAEGLEYAHGMGVIHRDIKPGNLLLSTSGIVKILDMGLARIGESLGADVVTTAQLTHSGQIMGTVDYMSPEQAQDTHRADERSDIYRLGCTLYRLLMAQPPYTGDTLTSRLLAHQQAPIPSLHGRRPDVPFELDEVFQKMIAKRPEDRYPSMGQVIAALKEVCTRRGDAAGEEDTLPAHAPHNSEVAGLLVGTGSGLAQLAISAVTAADDTLTTEAYQPTVTHAPQDDAEAPPRLATARKKHARWFIAGGAAVVLVTCAALGTWLGIRRDDKADDSARNDAIPAAHMIEVRQLGRLSRHIWRVVLSPDGKRAYACDNDKSIGAWEAETGKKLFTAEHNRRGSG